MRALLAGARRKEGEVIELAAYRTKEKRTNPMSKEPTEAAYVMSGQFTPDNRARPSRDDASNESS